MAKQRHFGSDPCRPLRPKIDGKVKTVPLHSRRLRFNITVDKAPAMKLDSITAQKIVMEVKLVIRC